VFLSRRLALVAGGAVVAAGCGGGSAASHPTKPKRLTAGLSLVLNPTHESADASELQVPESMNEQYDYATIWVFKPGRTATDFSIGKVSVREGRTTTGDWKSFGYGSKGDCTVNKEYGGYIVLSVLMDGTRSSCGSAGRSARTAGSTRWIRRSGSWRPDALYGVLRRAV
jgi:hypothetical protein